jgi:shikimate dehydrogenase
MGFGGVGKAVSAYVSKVLDNKSKLFIASRKNIDINNKSSNNKFLTSFNEIKDYINTIDILINCTSIGWNDQEDLCPISIDNLKLLKKDSLVFDVIYQPLETLLIKNAKSIGLQTMNGLEMNKEQAVLAFQYASKQLVNTDKKLRLLREAMSNV